MLQLFIGGALSKRKLERLRLLLSVELDRPLEITDEGGGGLTDPNMFIEKRGALYVEASHQTGPSAALMEGLRTLRLAYSAILTDEYGETSIVHGRPTKPNGWDETTDDATADGEPVISADAVRAVVVRARAAGSSVSDLVDDLSRILPLHHIADLPEFKVEARRRRKKP